MLELTPNSVNFFQDETLLMGIDAFTLIHLL